MSNFETSYQPLDAYNDNGEETPQDENVMIHVVPESGKARWNHIDDLDAFFSKVYHLHQEHGLLCMMLKEVLELVLFAFVVCFTVFLLGCVNYAVLFKDKPPGGVPAPNGTYNKVTLSDTVYPLGTCAANLNGWIILLLIITTIFWILRVFKVVYNFFQYLEIRHFYTTALKITPNEVENYTWYDVQRKMQEVQRDQQMCIHKADLTELDIYHRILRFKNYLVAMVNKSLLPIKFSVPFLGEQIFFSKGLKYNFELILFYGPWAPFENSWHLRDDYKKIGKRKELADLLSKYILYVGIINLILFPLIFIWQFLYYFFGNVDMIKREPSILGIRRWSIYGRYYCRHFNELDHELMSRMNRAYRLSNSFVTNFSSPVVVIAARFVAYVCSSIFAVVVLLMVWDEDVAQVEHVLTITSVLGIIVAVSRSLIPNAHLVFTPERLIDAIVSHIHYTPEHWKGNAHTVQVRNEFNHFFQFKLDYLLKEMLSPLLTPFILIFCLRRKSLDIVDFYRNFTVDVIGVGDVCSFAQMDLKKHGNPNWMSHDFTEATHYEQAEDGKTELSLLHFTATNPNYRLPREANVFVNQLRKQAVQDLELIQTLQLDNPLYHSLNSLEDGYENLISSLPRPMHPAGFLGQDPFRSSMASSYQPGIAGQSNPVLRGDVSRMEGPGQGSSTGLLSSVHQAMMNQSMGGSNSMMNSNILLGSTLALDAYASNRNMMAGRMETVSQEMNFGTVYLRELRHRQRNSKMYTDSSTSGRSGAFNLWQRPSGETGAGAIAIAMPIIQELPSESDDRTEKMPLLDTKFSKSS